jgi:hypothetical protein
MAVADAGSTTKGGAAGVSRELTAGLLVFLV